LIVFAVTVAIGTKKIRTMCYLSMTNLLL